MPGGDGTGPLGLGPMTGRGAGFCGGYGVPGYMNPYGGRLGLGFGRGWGGRGWRNMYYATGLPGWARAGYTPAWGGYAPTWGTYAPAWGAAATYGAPTAAAPTREQEVQMLRTQAEQLKAQLDAITQRMQELEQSST